MDPITILIITTIFSSILTLAGSGLNNKNAQNQAAQQNQYNIDAIEKQSELNRTAAKESYEMSTNYADQMQKMMAAGINSHYAAQYIGGQSVNISPAQVTARQAVAKENPLAGLSQLLQGIPAGVSEAKNQQLKRQEYYLNADIRKAELELKKTQVEMQKEIQILNIKKLTGEITESEYNFKLRQMLDNLEVTDPSTGQTTTFAELSAKHQYHTMLHDYNNMENETEKWEREKYIFENFTQKELPYKLNILKNQSKLSNTQVETAEKNLEILNTLNDKEALYWKRQLMHFEYLDAEQSKFVVEKIDNIKNPTLRNTMRILYSILSKVGGHASFGKKFGISY